jgi:hypothetical protein
MRGNDVPTRNFSVMPTLPAWKDVPLLLRRELDRIVIGIAFTAYGIVDLIVENARPFPFDHLQTFWDWQFVIAGVLYIVGTLVKSWPIRGVATILYAGGLATISVAVLFGSGSPTLLLILAFAVQGFADLRRLREKNTREAAEDVIAKARRARGG